MFAQAIEKENEEKQRANEIGFIFFCSHSFSSSTRAFFLLLLLLFVIQSIV